MPRDIPRKAFLVSVPLVGSDAVYAVLVLSEANAINAVAEAANADPASVAIVGLLSRKVVRTLSLKPGEVRRV